MSSSPLASTLMMRFAERTGIVSPAGPTRRYLWTDAFAVCNFIELRRDDLALALVNRVHHVLGRHRPDDARTGWISGLDAETGEAHPTLGGLRIGKPLAERGPNERIDERLEWDRDGQYFHYLTKWMHALDQLARASSQPIFNTWAGELAEAAYRTFVHGSPARMFWKMSIDLSRPQVASMGQHDPLDGFVTCLELSATAAELGAGRLNLGDATAAFASMIQPGALATTDPLGIGGLLVDAYRLGTWLLTDPQWQPLAVPPQRPAPRRRYPKNRAKQDLASTLDPAMDRTRSAYMVGAAEGRASLASVTRDSVGFAR